MNGVFTFMIYQMTMGLRQKIKDIASKVEKPAWIGTGALALAGILGGCVPSLLRKVTAGTAITSSLARVLAS